MPEAAIDKQNSSIARKNKVGPTGKVRLDLVSEPKRPERFAEP